MTRKMVAAAALATLALAVSAQAAGDPPYNQDYQAHPEGNQNYYVDFNVEKSNGTRKITKVTTVLPYVCKNDEASFVAYFRSTKPLRVKGNRRFAGKVPERELQSRRRGAPSSATLTLKGRVSKDGKTAKGTVESDLGFGNHSNALPCTTFAWDFKV